MRIFLSYRREDDPFAVGRLRDYLATIVGEERVFLDVLSVGPGVHFEEMIEETINRADLVLVLIGPRWESSLRRSGDRDYVEMEVGAALRHGKRVIPVLLGTRDMPAPDHLDGALAGLSVINALRVRADPDFRSDSRELASSLGLSDPQRPKRKRASRMLHRAFLAMSVIGLESIISGVIGSRMNDPISVQPQEQVEISIPTESSTGSPYADSSTTTLPAGFETVPTMLDPNEGWYPTADPQRAEFVADSFEALPLPPHEVRGYSFSDSLLGDSVALSTDGLPFFHPIFQEWAVSEDQCFDRWWVATWASSDLDVAVQAERVGVSMLDGPLPRLEFSGQLAHAGIISGPGCEVLALRVGDSSRGQGAASTDVTVRFYFFARDPATSGTIDCHPMSDNERLPLRLCDHGDAVAKVQAELNRLGYGPLEVDGDFGPNTERAVTAFQRAVGLPSSGLVTTGTWSVLFPENDFVVATST